MDGEGGISTTIHACDEMESESGDACAFRARQSVCVWSCDLPSAAKVGFPNLVIPPIPQRRVAEKRQQGQEISVR